MRRRIVLAVLLATWARAASGTEPIHARTDFATSKPSPDSAAMARECEYGIAMAFHGDTTRAEQAFLAILSHARGDARALNNLGNLRFASGDADLARAYYDLAAESDSLDSGIPLNRAIASWYLGDDGQADRDRNRAARLAGNPDSLLAWLDLPRTASEMRPELARGTMQYTGRGIRINPTELRQFLLRVAAQVPAPVSVSDTTRVRSGPVKSRMAGSRAGIGTDLMEILYWKR